MHLDSLGPGSCFSPSCIPSGYAAQGGYSGGWSDGPQHPLFTDLAGDIVSSVSKSVKFQLSTTDLLHQQSTPTCPTFKNLARESGSHLKYSYQNKIPFKKNLTGNKLGQCFWKWHKIQSIKMITRLYFWKTILIEK